MSNVQAIVAMAEAERSLQKAKVGCDSFERLDYIRKDSERECFLCQHFEGPDGELRCHLVEKVEAIEPKKPKGLLSRLWNLIFGADFLP